MQFVQIIQSSKDACIVRNASHNNFLVDYDLLDFLGLLLSWFVKILSIHFEMSELAFTYHHHLINIDYHHFNIYLNYWRCDSLQKKYSHFKKIYLISRNFYWEHTTKFSYRVPNPKTYLSLCTNSITDTKRNTTKTTIQSTLEYITDIGIPLIPLISIQYRINEPSFSS